MVRKVVRSLAGSGTSLISLNHLKVPFFCPVTMILKDYSLSNQFYAKLIQFWAEFRNTFPDKDNKSTITYVWMFENGVKKLNSCLKQAFFFSPRQIIQR